MKIKKILASLLAITLLSLQAPLLALADDGGGDPPAPPADTTNPVVSFLAPGSASVNHVVTVKLSATDDTAVTELDLSIDGAQVATSPDGNLSFNWDTSGVSEGSHTLLGSAKDAAGNVGTAVLTPQVKNVTGAAPQYAFNDATGKWDPTAIATFSWNAASGLWTSPLYTYDSKTGWYHVKPADTAQAVSNSLSDPLYNDGTAPTDEQQAKAALLASVLAPGDPSINNSGPNSINTANLNNFNSAVLNNLAQAFVNNTLNSNATSGDANVSANTNAGSATSGPAMVVANFLNFLNSMWSWSSGGLTTFVKNMFGSHTGDINLVPGSATGGGGQLGGLTSGVVSNSNTGPDSTNSTGVNNQNDLTINNSPTGSINNNINLLAQSGAANVSQNTTGGNATSGNATTELDILNLINSAISAGQSFFGMINIFGNLNGDILFPQGFLDGVAGGNGSLGSSSTASNSNTGPNSTNNADVNNQNTANVTNSPTAAFNNNITTAAQSGAAAVSSNTTAGSATTGAATTSGTLYNLLNTNVFGDNAVLVLVNVLGHWIGGIMNLPGGDDSSALLTGNATVSNGNTGPNSTNDANVNNQNNVNLTNSPSGTITNNINAGAVSGDATVTQNTHAGDATSGNASVATNVANIFGSSLNLKKWFGVLVINVFGDWFGSVGLDTAAGNTGSGAASFTSAGAGSGAVVVTAHTTKTTAGGTSGGSGAAGGSGSSASAGATSNASHTNSQALLAGAHTQLLAAKSAASKNNSTQTLIFVLAAALLVGSAGLMASERRIARKNR